MIWRPTEQKALNRVIKKDKKSPVKAWRHPGPMAGKKQPLEKAVSHA